MNDSSDKSTGVKQTRVITSGDSSSETTVHPVINNKWRFRESVGQAMNVVSDFINDNLLAVRYGTIASVAILSAYGIYKTPLFFRFENVADIPPHYFKRRKPILHGRLIQIELPIDKSFLPQHEQPITLCVHHLSPVGRLMNASTFQFFHRTTNQDKGLLRIEVAGVKHPLPYDSKVEREGEWLEKMVQSQARITLTLLSRRIVDIEKQSSCKNNSSIPETKYKELHHEDPELLQSAICKIHYRPGMEFFRKDLAQSLLLYGRAEMLTSGLLQIEIDSTRIRDGNQDVDILRRDIKYLQDELGNAEQQAIKQRRGAWSDEDVRNSRRLKIQEIMDFENESKSLLQRIYEWFRPNM